MVALPAQVGAITLIPGGGTFFLPFLLPGPAGVEPVAVAGCTSSSAILALKRCSVTWRNRQA